MKSDLENLAGAVGWKAKAVVGDVEVAVGAEGDAGRKIESGGNFSDRAEIDGRRYASKMNLQSWENHGSSLQYMGWMSERISLRLPVAGEVFFLDIPLYRKYLSYK